MNDYFKKSLNLISILPSKFYLIFTTYFIFALLVVFFEILAISFLMPLLTMLSNNNFDPSQFSNFINNVNNFTVDNFSINILKNILNLTISIFFNFFNKSNNTIYFYLGFSKNCYECQHFYSLKLYKSYLNKEYLFHLKNGPSKLFRNLMIEVNSFASSILFQKLNPLVEIFILLQYLFLLY